MKIDVAKLLPMGALIFVVWAAGVALGYVDALGLGPISVSLFGVGLIAFLGTLRAGADMRTAITVGFVVLYFAVFAALATSERNRSQFDTVVGLELWNNFTYLVGVIVIFYFGASTAVEITKHVKAPVGDNGANQPPTTLDADGTPTAS